MCLQYLFLLFFEDKILSSLQFRWSESKSDNFPNSWKLHASAVTLAGMCRTDSELFFPQNYRWSWVSSPKTVLFTHQSSTAHQSLSQGLGCSATAVHQFKNAKKENTRNAADEMLGWPSGSLGAAPAEPDSCQVARGSTPHSPVLPFHSPLHLFRAWSLSGKQQESTRTEHQAAALSYQACSEISRSINRLRQQHSPPLHHR